MAGASTPTRGSLCLAFAVTGEGERALHDDLHGPGDLDRWLAETVGVRTEAATTRDLGDANRLREAVWELTNARADDRRLPRDAVAEVNRAAAAPPLVPQLGGRTR